MPIQIEHLPLVKCSGCGGLWLDRGFHDCARRQKEGQA